MKKLLLLFYLSVVVYVSHAADWDLFPLNQKSFYQYKNFFQQNVVHEVLLDSVFVSGNTSVSFFLRKYQGLAHGNCYDQLIDNNSYLVEKDSLTQVNDTVIIYGYNRVLYFIPGAFVGQMWNTHDSLGIGGFTDLHITCTSIQLETFLGVTDSVKTFSVSSFNGSNHYPSNFDTLSIKLSKNYGLVQYIPFSVLRDHNTFNPAYHNLIGIQSAALSSGFDTPSYARFFPYHPGDILNWQYVGACSSCIPPVVIYTRDSITQVNFAPDTFSFHCWTWTAQDTFPVQLDTNRITKYAVADLANIFESPTNWISIAVGIYGMGAAFSPRYEIYNSREYVLQFTGNDTMISRSYYLMGFSLDTLTCNVYDTPDATYTIDANTAQGITKTCYDSWGPMCTYLIGSIILGDTVGYTDLAVGVPEIISKPDFVISPNPALSSFTISSNLNSQIDRVEIYNLLGEKIYSADYTETLKINCELFPKGCYFVLITSPNGTVVQKLIKQ